MIQRIDLFLHVKSSQYLDLNDLRPGELGVDGLGDVTALERIVDSDLAEMLPQGILQAYDSFPARAFSLEIAQAKIRNRSRKLGQFREVVLRELGGGTVQIEKKRSGFFFGQPPHLEKDLFEVRSIEFLEKDSLLLLGDIDLVKGFPGRVFPPIGDGRAGRSVQIDNRSVHVGLDDGKPVPIELLDIDYTVNFRVDISGHRRRVLGQEPGDGGRYVRPGMRNRDDSNHNTGRSREEIEATQLCTLSRGSGGTHA